MPKTAPSRLFFALIVAILLGVIGRNLYRRYLNNALIHAVESKNVAQVRSLLDQGVDANTKKPSENPKYPGSPLLSIAIESNSMASAAGADNTPAREEIARLLIQHGAHIQDYPQTYSSYLQDACHNGSVPVVRCLLEHGADPNYMDKDHGNAMNSALGYGTSGGGYAASSGNSGGGYAVFGAWIAPPDTAQRLRVSREMVALLRQHGARITAAQAVALDDAAMLRAVLASGADVNKPASGLGDALCAAADKGSLPLMEMLLKAGVNPNMASPYSGPPLSRAAGYNRGKASLATVKLLLAYGAKVNVVGANFDPPLVTAIVYKHADIARLLLARGADPNLKRTINNYLGSPLSAAARSLPELVPDLLARRAGINSDDGKPLKEAISAHRPDLARYLLLHGAKIYPAVTKTTLAVSGLQAGAKPTPTFVTNPSTLQTAVMNAPECFDLLMQAGADITPEKANVLLTAAAAGHDGLFHRLIALGANVNAMDAGGNTPLTEALKNAPAGVQTLLDHGANPNVVTMGLTPLLFVVQAGNTSLTRLLLAHGADVNLKPPRGHTPLYYARRHKNADILKLLEQADAKAE